MATESSVSRNELLLSLLVAKVAVKLAPELWIALVKSKDFVILKRLF